MLKRKHVSPRLQWLIVKQNQTMRLRHTVEEPRLCQWCPLMALLKLVSVKNDYIGFVILVQAFRKAWVSEVSSPALCATTLQCVAFLLTTWRVPKIYSNFAMIKRNNSAKGTFTSPFMPNFYRARTADSSSHKERYGGSFFLQKVERLCFHLHLGRSGGWRLDILLRIQTPP